MISVRWTNQQRMEIRLQHCTNEFKLVLVRLEPSDVQNTRPTVVFMYATVIMVDVE